MVPPNHPLKNRVLHYFHHPFWGKHPYFWKHPGGLPFSSSSAGWLLRKIDLASTLPPVHQLSNRCSTPGNFGCKTHRIRSNFWVCINICLHAPVWEYLIWHVPIHKIMKRFRIMLGMTWPQELIHYSLWHLEGNYTTIMFKRLFHLSCLWIISYNML